MSDLRKAAQALVDRWDSPQWGGSAENLKHTGDYIDALREALAQPDVPEVLFGGYGVLKALTPEAATRTTHVNVSDVLDAVVALMREGTAPKGGE